ncbi:MAG: hypothetical protein J6J35_03505 [Alphaproteobacteria bacterium]|nr:hypothetical protein [Alphaproteobacteria bacterium]
MVLFLKKEYVDYHSKVYKTRDLEAFYKMDINKDGVIDFDDILNFYQEMMKQFEGGVG